MTGKPRRQKLSTFSLKHEDVDRLAALANFNETTRTGWLRSIIKREFQRLQREQGVTV